MIVRPATGDDLPRILEIIAAVGYTVKDFDYSDMTHPMLVAEVDGAVVGFMQGAVIRPYSYIADTAVLPEHQNRGVVSALMAAMEDVFRDCGAVGWVSLVREDNEDTHRKIQTLHAEPVGLGVLYRRRF